MYFVIDKRVPNQQIRFSIVAKKPTRMVILLQDATKENTYYFRNNPIIQLNQPFRIKVPDCPPLMILEIFNEANGQSQTDNSFIVSPVKISPLNINLNNNGILNANAKSFAKFSDNFAKNASILPTRKDLYTDPSGIFSISYVYIIRDSNGNELATPARVNGITKTIEIAKKYYRDYSVPERKAINWHEYSHVWKNVNPASEFEADKNAIFMYLETGNPKLPALQVFTKVFQNADNELNRERDKRLKYYIDNFEKLITENKYFATGYNFFNHFKIIKNNKKQPIKF